MCGDLEDGEIEDGEIPDEEGGNGGNKVVHNEPERSPSSSNTPKTLAPQSDVISEVKSQLSTPKLKRSVMNRSGVLVNHRHIDRLKENTVEDDWAGDVEKAIKAAMSSKESDQDLNSEVICSGGETKTEEDDERKARRRKRKKKHREDDEERKEAKKRKRSHGTSKENVAEEAMELGQVAGSDQGDDDDDEMLFVRGASPIMRSGYSPPGHGYHDEPFGYVEPGGPFEDPYDSYCDDSDYEREDFVRSRRGDEEGPKRGRGAKRRQQGRGGGRGIQNKRQQGGRKDAVGSKGKRIANKRQQQRAAMLMQDPRQGPESICMFYMQGKCQKGDECPYSHDAMPPRKMELCKFYLMDCCAKKDKCLYMHSDFPCKFYHTGLKCFAGERCKFSHGTLTETLRAVLLKHLETAPKEILGDFPRLSREGAAAMVYNKKNRGNKGVGPGNKKIPSLFEIEVPIPAQLLAGNLHAEEERSPARRGTPMPDSDNEDQDGCRTPMPSSPRMDGRNISKEFTGRSSNRQWDADDGARPGDSGDEDNRHPRPFRCGPDNREKSEEREVPRRPTASYQDRDFSEQLQQLKMRFYQETLSSADEAGGSMEVRHHRHRHRRGKTKILVDDEEQTRRKINLHRLAGYSPAHASDSDEGLSRQDSKAAGVETMELADEEGKLEIDDQRDDDDNEEENDGGKTPPGAPSTTQDSCKKDQPDTDHNSSCSTETGGLPLNLPKKQRELFLRIQQQQREAADSSSQDQSGEDDGKDADVEQQQEENWYSSDEEEASLADVLKNLSKQQQQSSSPPRASTTPPLPAPIPITTASITATHTPPFDSIKLSEIDISESVSKLLSSIRNQQNVSTASTISTTQVAENTDPRLSSTSHMGQASITQARDPRLVSRDPRNRSGNATTSMSLLSPSTYDGTRHDPRASKRSDSSEDRRTSIYSAAITSPSVASTSTTHSRLEGGGDVDLRSFLSGQQQQNTGFETGSDVDLRQNMLMRASTSSSYAYGDTDLRSQGPGGDVDLRGMLGLPFKPVPMHTPATEIEASLTSHLPIPYKVVPITIPRPDYSGLKLNTSDPQVRNDPRLRKLFKMSNTTLDSPASPPPPPPPPPPPKQSPRSDPRRRSTPATPHATATTPTRLQESAPMYSDMMVQNSINLIHNTGIVPNLGAGLGYDVRVPRNPRNAPGILGPAPLPPNYCPNTPRFEDVEEGNSNGSDTDLRMFYGRMGNAAPNMEMQAWDQQSPQSQGQRMHRNRNWRNNRRSQQRFQHPQQEQQRSFTPPL